MAIPGPEASPRRARVRLSAALLSALAVAVYAGSIYLQYRRSRG